MFIVSQTVRQRMVIEAWWRRGNTFASHCYGLGSTPGPHVRCLSPFTADAWWFSPWGFLPPSEGLKIVPLGTVS